MTLLLDPSMLMDRAALVAGTQAPFARLADALAAGLEPMLGREDTLIPTQSAQLSREGGRCAQDGALLDFDPWNPLEHRCPRCHAVFTGERHHRHWLYWYHLWLAERVLHAAILWRLRGDERHLASALALLGGYCSRYHEYPNRDNLLGPSRVFFSTYLESIWLLQLVLAVDLLESADAGDSPKVRATVHAFRDRVAAPGVELIASFDEGASNRQVWNGAALIAAGALLGRGELVERSLFGDSGLVAQLRTGLLADGSWYEGENYHLFAHRGLWYGVMLAERLGVDLPEDALSRFDGGCLAPLATMLPDLTLPSRRDSQYAISLRQPRFAEMAELGFARTGHPVLAALLHRLYDGSVARRETGQRSSTADVERNVAPTALSRADLGWRSLLMAAPALPTTDPLALRSALLPAQGIAVFRRQGGELYAALDYGTSGGGHGHPDRLNVLLMQGATRWLDDVGTGSYVERTLHWYRSTLAHNAPLVDGRSQLRVDGTLLAHDERGFAGRVVARAGIAPGVSATRSLVVLDGYLLDELHWTADRDVTVDLPLHLQGAEPLGASREAAPSAIPGGGGHEDGFEFLANAAVARLPQGSELRLRAARDGRTMKVTIACGADAEWWRAVTPPAPLAPGLPQQGTSTLHLLRQHGRTGSVRSLWSWTPDVEARLAKGQVRVTLPGGAVHVHHTGTHDGDPLAAPHTIELTAGGGRSSIVLDGRIAAASPLGEDRPGARAPAGRAPVARLHQVSANGAWYADEDDGSRRGWFVRMLGESHYRRSEQSWRDAGEPAARVAIAWTGGALLLDVAVRKAEPPRFVLRDAVNPYDNEQPDIDGDGVQLYVRGTVGGGAWILVPEETGAVRVRALPGWGGGAAPDVRWRRTPEGYELRAELPLVSGAPGSGTIPIALDVLVNETAGDRERRRGQLVLSGGGDWLYLRGDRHDPARLLPFVLERES